MKYRGNPGPSRISVIFENGEFAGKSVTMDAEPLLNGVALYADTIRCWDGEKDYIDMDIKKRIVQTIKKESVKDTNIKFDVVD
jgi:hypothetical protein